MTMAQLQTKPARRRVPAIVALEAIEDALIKEGYDNILAPTEHGAFHWITPNRARLIAVDGRDCPVELEPNVHYQRIEDALLKAGFDDYMVVTRGGSFHWRTAERLVDGKPDLSGE